MPPRRNRSLELVSVCAALGLCAPLAQGQAGWARPTGAATVVDERLVEARARFDRAKARRAEIDAELSSLDPRKSALRGQLAQHGRSLYRVSRSGLLPLAGGLEALLGHASRVERLKHLVEHELEELRGLETRGVSLRKEALDLDVVQATSERDVRALEQARMGLSQQQAAEQMFDAAFSAPLPRMKEPDRISYGLSIIGGSNTGAAQTFADERGSLALPVSGPNRIEEASRAESDGPGLAFSARSGSAVRAAAGGRVAFADRYGSYGQLVIIEHGERYYTVYGGLSQIEVAVGDDVSKSARLGSVGMDPVYFEVRRGTRTQDARSWLGL